MHNDMPYATLFDFIKDQDLKFIQLISNNVNMCQIATDFIEWE